MTAKDQSILFSAPMILALLADRKTQTRRLAAPRWKPGDFVWVRENFTLVPATAYRMSEGVQQTVNTTDRHMAAIYAAGWDRSIPKWKPSIHMPRWASRLTLEITAVRQERLQDISEADIIAEGAPIDHDHRDTTQDGSNPVMCLSDNPWLTQSPRAWYHRLWDQINGAGPWDWDANPLVNVTEFALHKANIDAVKSARQAA